MKSCTTVTTLKKLALAIAVVAITAGARHAVGAITLTNIPVHPYYHNANNANEARAITPDGKYVVGFHGPYNTAGMTTTNGPGFLYDVENGIVRNDILAGVGSYACALTGVGYRTENGTNEVVIDGWANSQHANYMTTNGGVNWAYGNRRDAVLTSLRNPAANSMAGTSSDVFYEVTWDIKNGTSDDVTFNLQRFSGAWPSGSNVWSKQIPYNAKAPGFTGVSSTGRAVGYRNNPRQNYVLQTNGVGLSTWYFNGLKGNYEGEPWSVNGDGTVVFGRSPTLVDTRLNGYKAVLTAAVPGVLQRVDALPHFSDTGGSTSLDVPYGCTADGRYAVGMNYRGVERAALWDTGNADTNLWTISDLTDLATANGVADIFTRLVRAYSVGTNGAGDPVITGAGSDGSYTRAFVMTVPKWIAAIGFPGHQTVDFGANVTFSLITNGVDSLTYQWYRNNMPLANGGNISGVTTPSLTVTGVTCPAGDAGNYQVVVSNATISAVVTGSVSVLTIRDPFISVQPVSQTNMAGTTAIFSVTASGSSTLSYQWKHDGIDLTDGPTGFGSTVFGATAATLTISNVATSDGGTYTVNVSIAPPCETTSAGRTLTVLVPPTLTVSGDPVIGITLSWPVITGWTYELQYATDLGVSNWTFIIEWPWSYGDPAMITDYPPPTDSQRFYRVLMRP